MLKRFVVSILVVVSHPATHAQFVEKLSLSIARNAVDSAVTSAANKRIDEIANNSLQPIFNDVSRQAKMSPTAIQQLKNLKSGAYGFNTYEQAVQLLAWINSDTRDLLSLSTASPLGASISFSPRYNTVRLKWANVVQDITCQKTEYLNTWPPSVRNTTFQLKEEAEYRVYRNDKLLTTISGERVTDGSSSFRLPKFKLGPISIRLRGSISGNPEFGTENSEPLIYDFDPYQGMLGQPVRYRVEAVLKGCYFPEWLPVATSSDGRRTFSTGDIWLDSDGNSYPDFYPTVWVYEARQDFGPHISLVSPTDHEIVWYWQTPYYNLRTTIAGVNPSGSVEYYVNGQLRATRSVVNGVSEIPLDVLQPGSSDNFAVWVLYSGDAQNRLALVGR
jgi:hypothetical protein